MGWVASTLHTTSQICVSSVTTADAHNSAASSQMNWCPCWFKWTRLFRRKTKSGFCARTITFQTQSTLLILFHNDKFYQITTLVNNYSWNMINLRARWCDHSVLWILLMPPLNSEINPTRCNNCVYSSQWLYSTCFGWQFHPSSGVQCCIWPVR